MKKQPQTSEQLIASNTRLIGSLILIGGLILLGKAFLTDINLHATDSSNINAETLLSLPKKLADKTNNTILGGFLIVVGIQLCLVSTKLVTEIKEQFQRPL